MKVTAGGLKLVLILLQFHWHAIINDHCLQPYAMVTHKQTV